MDPVRTLIAAAMLLGAAALDLRARRVPNRYWVPFIACAAVFVLTDALDGEWLHLAGASLLSFLAYGFFRLGMWGGADAKAVMVLAFLVRDHLGGITLFAGFDILLAGFLLVLLWPLGMAAINAVRGRWAFPAMFLGIQMPLEVARKRHVWPMETPEGQWTFQPIIGASLQQRYHALAHAGRDILWVTPQLPLLAFIAIGFLFVSVFGSPIGWIAALGK